MKLTKKKLRMIANYVNDNSLIGWHHRAAAACKNESTQKPVTTQTIRNFVNGIGYSNETLVNWFVNEYEELQEVDRLINDK